jgi:hypothetical protein
VIFDVPGMVLATMFVSRPFVVREVEPVLRGLRRIATSARYSEPGSGLVDVKGTCGADLREATTSVRRHHSVRRHLGVETRAP